MFFRSIDNIMLPHLQLGATGINISPIGLGTVKFGRNQQVKYPQPFAIPTDAEVSNLLAVARELNINLLDTAPAYGNSEERLGKLLAGQRQDWVIVTKVGEEFSDGISHYDFTAQHINFSVRRSLKRLGTDYLDVVLVHSSGADLEIINNYPVFAVLSELKQAGLIRAFGMSTKTVAGGIATVEQADVAMVTYNPTQQEEKPVLDLALALHKGIFIKKAFASGHLDPQAALKFIYQNKAVNSVIVGTINPEHLRQNVASYA